MPFEASHVIGRLNKVSKQVQKGGGILSLRVEGIEVWPLHFKGIAVGSAPFHIEIQTLPAVADGCPDLAPSGLRPQNVNHHPSAVTAGLVAIQFQKPVFTCWKILPVGDG